MTVHCYAHEVSKVILGTLTMKFNITLSFSSLHTNVTW